MSLKRHVPRSVVALAKRVKNRSKVQGATAALAAASGEPSRLEAGMLDELMEEYPVARPWSNDVIPPQADADRAALVVSAIGSDAKSLLEIGGGPGYVSWAVKQSIENVTSIDIGDGLHPGARAAGVVGHIADACQLPFPDNTFDGAWSFNAFEHIHDPAGALNEAWRVTRPHGRIYINFAPLYNSAFGLHAFYEIGVPFVQHLFDKDLIRSRVTNKDLWHLNEWSVARWRALWNSFSLKLKPISLREEEEFTGVELIRRFPSCFASRSRDVNEFLVSKFVLTFEVWK